MHKPDFRLSARRLRSPAIGLVILTLLAWRWWEDYRVR